MGLVQVMFTVLAADLLLATQAFELNHAAQVNFEPPSWLQHQTGPPFLSDHTISPYPSPDESLLPFPEQPLPVSLPAPNASSSFWLDSPGANPLANEGSNGSLTGDADVCVIGSGITGIGAVWNLVKGFRERPRVRRENLTVVVFEAREFCEWCMGSAARHSV